MRVSETIMKVAIFGAPKEGDIIELANPMGGLSPVQFIILIKH